MDSPRDGAVDQDECKDDISFPYECQFCETIYPSLDTYTAHSAVHETQFTYEHNCRRCSRAFACKEELQLHSRLHCDDLKPYKCKLCKQSFRLARSLEYHLMEHGSRRIFTCSMCPATFVTLDDIHEHLRDHQMGRVETQLQVQVEAVMGNGGDADDGDGEATADDDDDDDDDEEEEEEEKYTPEYPVGQEAERASEATTKFNRSGLEQQQENETKADVAGATNGGVAVVGADHHERHQYDEDEEAIFARAVNVKKTFCNLCNKKMATRKSLNTHYKSVHMKNAHTCTVCRTSFLFSRLLDEHTERRKRIIPCEFCDQRFCSNKRWDSHIAKHRADSVGVPGVVVYPRAVPLSSTTSARQSQQAPTNSMPSAAIVQRHSLLKMNHNNITAARFGNSNAATTTTTTAASSASPSTTTASPSVTVVNLTTENPASNTLGKFPCDACGKIFLSLHYLQSHLVKRRNANFQFQCDVCEHRFSKKAILDEHKVYHQRMASRRAVPKLLAISKQQVVNGSDKVKVLLGANGKRVDGGLVPVKLSEDEMEMDYEKHIVRLSDASFKCNCCHRTFKAINHLKCHLRYTHMKKDFKCRSCSQQFPFYKLYLGHMKNSKLCERCDKRICAKFDFRIHTQKCRGTAKMRNSTGGVPGLKSSVVEIKDEDEEAEQEEEDGNENEEPVDPEDLLDEDVIMEEAGGGGGNLTASAAAALQNLHSSLMLPTDDLSEYPSIPHFLMDDLLAGAGPEEEYKCEACGKVFAKMTSLHMHSFQHEPNKELKCIFCNFLFLQRSSLNRHYRCRNTLHTCQVCRESFCSHLNLRQHICVDGQRRRDFVDATGLASAGDNDEYLDISDVKAAESRKRSRTGTLVSSGGSGTRGSGAGVNSEDVSGRDESIELSDTEPDVLACMMCPEGKVMSTKAELDHHVATEHGTVTKCPVCCKSFRSPTILHIHMAARASKKNKIECPNCTHRFNKQSEFRKHFMFHTMKENRPGISDEVIYSRIASKYPGK